MSLPDFDPSGDLPYGVHCANWQEFQARFGIATPRRVWLFGRLRELMNLADSGGCLRRVFVWGSFVTANDAPRDIDLLLIMSDDFETDRIAPAAQVVFDSVQAKLLFGADVFWARGAIGEETLQLWLETYQTSRAHRKRGIVELQLP